ncbi:response regulator transcription factor [Nonlabens mediterrranea]|uniref:Response regulator transcription factor n=2 Tax=Nonlabens mediterrranea TaxID=1419947 RepID=A0ABS0A2U6_9FLAO|nr:DNA-binding response regulator, LuxR family [Flavobacteria bacterium BBFL7]MBF4983683.1 response regulator transcription factor [Nonlabens mediterrranea]
MIKLLIAEDHQSLIDGLILLFKEDSEIEVIGTAKDGKELLEKLVFKKPNVLLTDISMPRLNGVELCKKALTLQPELKVIAFSMFNDEDAIKEMIKAGAYGYILKTSSLQEVKTAIIKAYRGERYFDASINIKEIGRTETSNKKTILSPSETKILKLIAQGKTSSEIAEIRFTAVSTIIKHRKNIIQKLGLQGKGELLRYALQKHQHFK